MHSNIVFIIGEPIEKKLMRWSQIINLHKWCTFKIFHIVHDIFNMMQNIIDNTISLINYWQIYSKSYTKNLMPISLPVFQKCISKNNTYSFSQKSSIQLKLQQYSGAQMREPIYIISIRFNWTNKLQKY